MGDDIEDHDFDADDTEDDPSYSLDAHIDDYDDDNDDNDDDDDNDDNEEEFDELSYGDDETSLKKRRRRVKKEMPMMYTIYLQSIYG